MLHARQVRLLGVLALLLGILIAAGGRADAGLTRGSLTIHARLCPAGGPTTDIFAECHGTPVPAGWNVAFRIHHRPPQAPDSRGNVVFRHLAAGPHLLVQVGGPDPATVRVRVWCSAAGPGAAFRELRGHTVPMDSGDRMVCDWYFIPVRGA